MRRLVIPVLALAAVVASSCGAWRPDDAARVNGVELGASRLEADTRALLDQPGVAQVFLGGGAGLSGPTGTAEGAPEGRLPTTAVNSLLERRIIQQMAEEELAGRGIGVTEADLDEAERAIRDELTAAGASGEATSPSGQPVDLVASFDALPEGLRAGLIRGDAVVARLRQELAAGQLGDFPADAEAWYRANPGQFDAYCLTVVPVADEAEGSRLADDSAAGRVTLAELVARQNGREVPCRPGFQLPNVVDELAATPIGRAVGPYLGSDGATVLLAVTSRTPTPFAQVEAEAAQLYRADRASAENGPWQEWLAAQRPEVSIDPRYGTWDAEGHAVRPPVGTQAPVPTVAS